MGPVSSLVGLERDPRANTPADHAEAQTVAKIADHGRDMTSRPD